MKRAKIYIQVYQKVFSENACRVREGASLLVDNGWGVKSRTWSSWLLNPPVGADVMNPVVEVLIPDVQEIRALAGEIHEKKRPWRGRLFGWNAEYSISQERIVFGRPRRRIGFPAYFFIGELGLWMISLRWEDGDDKEPRLITDDSNIFYLDNSTRLQSEIQAVQE